MIELHLGDCLDVMRDMADSSVDAVVTDPPYELGFMGKKWDSTGIAYNPEVWAECLRLLKPGGHLLAFGGARTYHRMVCAIEDAGFEIRDQIMWIYGSGFPKSLDVGKAIDKAAGAMRTKGARIWRGGLRENNGFAEAERRGGGTSEKTLYDIPATPAAQQWDGWGTALKPAHEPIVVARKPLIGTVAANVRAWGTGAINVDGCRVETDDDLSGGTYGGVFGASRNPDGSLPKAIGSGDKGRWPANVIHDGSDEVVALFPNDAARFFYCAKASKADRDEGLEEMEAQRGGPERMNNSNGRKAEIGDAERLPPPRHNTHPTVKPTALMRYLCRLVTPPGGIVLDPFMGSGSTGKGAVVEGFSFVGIDLEAEYVEIARRRIGEVQARPRLEGL
jgi:site-specific DNA-methyltransferase (adenine-specific)